MKLRKPEEFKLAAVALFAMAVAPAADAQQASSVDERLLACSSIEDTAEKAACFDNVVNEMKGADETDVIDTAPTPTPTPTPTASAGATAAATGAAAATESASSPAPVMQIEKQAEEAPEEFVEFTSSIVNSKKSGRYHFIVELDNGQVWEETDGSRRPSVPKVGQPVRVYEGRFGGYRMKIGNDNRIAWVRRLK